MRTSNKNDARLWGFPPCLTKEDLADPQRALIQIYGDHSLKDLLDMAWSFFEATQHLEEDELPESRPTTLMYYFVFVKLITATWILAKASGELPNFDQDFFDYSIFGPGFDQKEN
jgi:hypothetical protein